ncbi:hypothetical protein E2C01_083207 [Portunus trituberculatus]|uniref:Uncharacterized protein n=1 Tax=Portunus trituberculatus TaxID=210409 RepID=A0A5B7J2U6_PORTR|nr:hypothetical protein [Portunus trituberculatus]
MYGAGTLSACIASKLTASLGCSCLHTARGVKESSASRTSPHSGLTLTTDSGGHYSPRSTALPAPSRPPFPQLTQRTLVTCLWCFLSPHITNSFKAKLHRRSCPQVLRAKSKEYESSLQNIHELISKIEVTAGRSIMKQKTKIE